MSGINLKCVIICALVLWQISDTDGRIIHRIRDFNEPVADTINQCRSTCLSKFLVSQANILSSIDRECTKRPDCFMCWDYCRILYEERRVTAKRMCNDIFCVSK